MRPVTFVALRVGSFVSFVTLLYRNVTFFDWQKVTLVWWYLVVSNAYKRYCATRKRLNLGKYMYCNFFIEIYLQPSEKEGFFADVTFSLHTS